MVSCNVKIYREFIFPNAAVDLLLIFNLIIFNNKLFMNGIWISPSWEVEIDLKVIDASG